MTTQEQNLYQIMRYRLIMENIVAKYSNLGSCDADFDGKQIILSAAGASINLTPEAFQKLLVFAAKVGWSCD